MSDLTQALATIMANDPRQGAVAYEIIEKRRKEEKLKRISEMVDLSEPSFKGIRALAESGLVSPEQAFNMTINLKQYQNNVAAQAYNIAHMKFQELAQVIGTQMDWLKTKAYLDTQRAQQKSIDSSMKYNLLNEGRKTIDMYYKPFENSINREIDLVLKEIGADLQAKAIDVKNVFDPEKAREMRKAGDKLGMAADVLNKEYFSKEEREKYYKKLNALAYFNNIVDRAKYIAYKYMDAKIGQQGVDALFRSANVASLGLVKATQQVNDVGYHMNLNLNQNDTAKGLTAETEKLVDSLAHRIFGGEIGDAILMKSKFDAKIYGESVVTPMNMHMKPIVENLDDLSKEADEENGMDLSSITKGVAGIAGAAGVGMLINKLIGMFRAKVGKGETEFDKKVKQEVAKVDGVDLNEVENVVKEGNQDDISKKIEELTSKRKSAIKKAQEFVGGSKEPSKGRITLREIAKLRKLGKLGGKALGLVDAFDTYMQLKDYMDFIERAKSGNLSEDEKINLGLMQ